MNMRNVLLYISAGVLVTCASGCTNKSGPGVSNQVPENPESPSQVVTPSAEVSDSQAKVSTKTDQLETTILAVDLAKEFIQDAERALSKYKDQELQVTGAVAYPAGRFGRVGTMELAGVKDDEGMHDIKCRFYGMEHKKVEAASVTQEVTINGKVESFEDGYVRLTSCQVVRLGEDPAVKLSIVELTKAYAENADAAATKYFDKPIISDGVVDTVEKNGFSILLLGYSPEEGNPILARLEINLLGFTEDEMVSPGDHVVIKALVGEFTDYSLQNDELQLRIGWVLERR